MLGVRREKNKPRAGNKQPAAGSPRDLEDLLDPGDLLYHYCISILAFYPLSLSTQANSSWWCLFS